jgi:hypothetical protein
VASSVNSCDFISLVLFLFKEAGKIKENTSSMDAFRKSIQIQEQKPVSDFRKIYIYSRF